MTTEEELNVAARETVSRLNRLLLQLPDEDRLAPAKRGFGTQTEVRAFRSAMRLGIPGWATQGRTPDRLDRLRSAVVARYRLNSKGH